jgi:pimeloyl-ACP methyl ester carboxylesterase
MENSLVTKYIMVNNFNVRYVDNGKESQPVIFIHGLGGSVESWNSNLNQLAHRNLRIVALDLPGFGCSDKHETRYSIDFYANFVKLFLDALEIKNNISIIGSSLGGQIGAEIAVRNENAISKLVLISPAGASPRSFKGTPSLRNYLKILKAKSQGEVKEALSSLDNRPVNDFFVKTTFERLLMAGSKAAFVSALKESSRAPRFIKKIAAIKVKILVLWGKEDNIIPVKFSEPFIKLPNCRLLLIEYCGHRVHLERPKLFNSTVYDFICE